MDECKVSGHTEGFDYDALVDEMQTDLYWVRFFARPCCPAPDLKSATAMLDRLIGEVQARNDLSPAQQSELCALIESRKTWYPTSGLCRTTRSN